MISDFLEKVKNEWDLLLPKLENETIQSLDQTNLKVDFLNKEIKNLPNNLKYGIYLFKIIPKKEFSINSFQTEWNKKNDLIKTPKIYPRRIELQKESREVFDFYIGKSEKLSYRIKEHCFQKITSTTYGMKLEHQKYLIENATLSVSFFEVSNKLIDVKQKPIIQFVITNLEKKLRERYNPWIGKQ